jgi:tetratricopeptide (TPR) repeat protein
MESGRGTASKRRVMRSSAKAAADRPGWPLWLLSPLFWLAAALAYFPALRGGLLWDDIGHLTRSDLSSISGLWRIWFEFGATQQYYPVTHSAFWLFNSLWGDATLGYHLVNVSLHAMSAFLLILLLRKLEVPGALLAGAIFLLHPVEVESVAWIAELKNALSGVLYFGAALAYLRFDASRSRRAYAVAFALFSLAVFSKTVAATLPAALLVVFWWKRGRIRWEQHVRPLLPLFVLGLAGGLTTAWFERTLIGASGAEFELGLVERFLVAGRAVWFYFGKLLWPANLMFMYPRWEVSGAVWWQYLYPLAAAGALLAFWAIRKRSRAPLAAALLFGGTLFPALGFINVYPFRYSFVADHFQYLAGVSIIACVSAALTLLAGRTAIRKDLVQPALTALIGLPLAFLTWNQSHHYVNGERLLIETLARNPGCWMCHDNLADACGEAGDFAGGMEHSLASLKIAPDNAGAHYNLATAYSRLGRKEEAIREYQEAIRLNPRLVAAHQYLGLEFVDAGRMPEALKELEETVRLAPRSPGARSQLGFALLEQGEYEKAVSQLEEALRLNANTANVHEALGSALRELNRHEDALTHYREAARLDPTSSERLNNFGAQLQQMGQLEEAAVAFRESLLQNPGAAMVHVNLGMTLQAMGRLEEAAAEYKESLRLDPGNDDVRYALEQILSQPRP